MSLDGMSLPGRPSAMAVYRSVLGRAYARKVMKATEQYAATTKAAVTAQFAANPQDNHIFYRVLELANGRCVPYTGGVVPRGAIPGTEHFNQCYVRPHNVRGHNRINRRIVYDEQYATHSRCRRNGLPI